MSFVILPTECGRFVCASLLGHQHLAQLTCEYLRMEQFGRTEDGSFHIPLTQMMRGWTRSALAFWQIDWTAEKRPAIPLDKPVPEIL